MYMDISSFFGGKNSESPESIENTTFLPEDQYLYLIQVEKDFGSNVYKPGKTTRNPYSRFKEYNEKFRVIQINSVTNCDISERELLGLFKQKFGNPVRGREYFEGNLIEMLDIMHTVIKNIICYLDDFQKQVIMLCNDKCKNKNDIIKFIRDSSNKSKKKSMENALKEKIKLEVEEKIRVRTFKDERKAYEKRMATANNWANRVSRWKQDGSPSTHSPNDDRYSWKNWKLWREEYDVYVNDCKNGWWGEKIKPSPISTWDGFNSNSWNGALGADINGGVDGE